MNNSSALFTPAELMGFQAIVKRQVMSAVLVPLLIAYLVLRVLALAMVAIIEWEIIYQVFDYLAGETDGHWAPELMALTAAVMILGFHLLSKVKPNNLAVRIVELSVQILIPLYLFGIGLLIAAILYADGLAGMVEPPVSLTLGALPEAITGGWMDQLFMELANPVAILTLALGIGGLAVINIFVAHRLIALISENIGNLSSRTARARQALKDHSIIRRAQKDYAALGIEMDSLQTRDDITIQLQIANDVIAVIADALLPHKTWLTEQAVSTNSRFESEDDIDTKLIAKEIARIEAISLKDVLAALNPKCLEGKS